MAGPEEATDDKLPEDAESAGRTARFMGGRPAAAGRMIGVASIAISGRKSRGLSVSYHSSLTPARKAGNLREQDSPH